jgi:hypothetical protein
MQQPGIKLLQLTAAVANGIALAQAVAGAGNLTLNGSLASGGVATLGVAGTNLAARRIIITSTGADGAIVFTVTGTNRYGAAQSETITGVTTSPVQSQYDYQTVTQIAVSGVTAGNISAGTNTVASTEWVQWNFLETGWFVSGAVSGGASTYTVEDTWDDTSDIGASLTAAPQQFATEAASQIPPHVFTHTGYTSPLTGDNSWDQGARPCRATRVTVNTGTALVICWFLQVGERS